MQFFLSGLPSSSARLRFGTSKPAMGLLVAILVAFASPWQLSAAPTRPAQRHSVARPGKAASPAPAASRPAPEPQVRPAAVVLSHGFLKVTADNSDLSQILGRIASMSGMTVDGLSSAHRIYGVYGPGQPGEVLSDLLADSGYNFLMLGRTADGAPRKLVLMLKRADTQSPARSNAVSLSMAAAGLNRPITTANQTQVSYGADQNQASDAADYQSQSPADQDQSPEAEDEEPPGPGAIVNVPPSDLPDSQDLNVRVQQNLERLEQMQQSQEQQNPQ